MNEQKLQDLLNKLFSDKRLMNENWAVTELIQALLEPNSN